MAENQNRSQIEVTLAYMAIGVTAASVVSMALTLILSVLGVSNMPAFLAQLPLVGFPIGFLLIIGMLISSIVRKGKENRS
ncbi:hypothetical protein HRU87_01695 [Aquiluna borgnonia]|jgi:formate hydrogenlyase subunit 3/multisubunit Na+/H+ antiporter MnhD subunit|uniref:Uncharacterized protein n=1 Tax=Aquiluna borgnonia TaxID=2499157 RepID=A0A7D4Q4C1_9MICO|nr:hypothetical protein [Aquiluna borgnonia]QKJ24943.1 hypothetical protein HRU87_01695 [Aquiluna borgnonia]